MVPGLTTGWQDPPAEGSSHMGAGSSMVMAFVIHKAWAVAAPWLDRSVG